MPTLCIPFTFFAIWGTPLTFSREILSTSSKPKMLKFSSNANPHMCVDVSPHLGPRALVQDATSSTLHELCQGQVPYHILQRASEIGYVLPTEVQQQSLPILLSGKDCIIHAQTGSGKTLAYLLRIFSVVNVQRSAVQALIVVPTRELGIQVTKVARMLAAKPSGCADTQKTCTIMTLLDGGLLKRQKCWIKAEPPEIVIATVGSLCQMLEKRIFKLEAIKVLVVDEVDFLFYSSKQGNSLRKLLTTYSTIDSRQTVFVSASIPQHHHFLQQCMQQKWTKRDTVHVHVNPVEPMPSCLCHKFVICKKRERLQVLLALLKTDDPNSTIIFVNDQAEKARKHGLSSLTTVVDFLKASYPTGLKILLLEDGMNFNARTTSLYEVLQSRCILVATDIAGRGVDLPETTHIYNFDMPKTAVDYLHRAGRTGRKPFSSETCVVTTLITQEERFVLQRFENELMFQSEELHLGFQQ